MPRQRRVGCRAFRDLDVDPETGAREQPSGGRTVIPVLYRLLGEHRIPPGRRAVPRFAQGPARQTEGSRTRPAEFARLQVEPLDGRELDEQGEDVAAAGSEHPSDLRCCGHVIEEVLHRADAGHDVEAAVVEREALGRAEGDERARQRGPFQRFAREIDADAVHRAGLAEEKAFSAADVEMAAGAALLHEAGEITCELRRVTLLAPYVASRAVQPVVIAADLAAPARERPAPQQIRDAVRAAIVSAA